MPSKRCKKKGDSRSKQLLQKYAMDKGAWQFRLLKEICGQPLPLSAVGGHGYQQLVPWTWIKSRPTERIAKDSPEAGGRISSSAGEQPEPSANLSAKWLTPQYAMTPMRRDAEAYVAKVFGAVGNHTWGWISIRSLQNAEKYRLFSTSMFAVHALLQEWGGGPLFELDHSNAERYKVELRMRTSRSDAAANEISLYDIYDLENELVCRVESSFTDAVAFQLKYSAQRRYTGTQRARK